MSEWNMYDTLSEGKRNNNLCMHGPVAAAAAAALCIAILLFLQLLLFVMVCRMTIFLLWFIASDRIVFFPYFIQTGSIFNVPLVSTFAFTASIFLL